MSFNTARAPGRMEDRFDAPDAVVIIDGHEYKIRDWSARGLSITGYEKKHERGKKLRCVVNYMLNGSMKSFESGLYVVRMDDHDNVLASVFVDYDRLTGLQIDEIFYPEDAG